MSAEDQYDEYLETFDAVYAAMHDAALLANTTARITPPVLYQALGNLRAAMGALTEVLPSLARAGRTGAEDLELYDSDGNDPQQQLTLTLNGLEDATRVAHQLLTQLDTAQAQIGSVGHRD